MSISEQVKELRVLASIPDIDSGALYDLNDKLYQAADTIESLSAKLQAADMARSEDCGGGWIPCKERLPEEDVNVLVQVSGTYRNITFEDAFELATYIKGEGWTLESYPDIYNPNIIAWQPLPELYHEP